MFPVETVIDSIVDNEVHIVRMNSHLQLSTRLVPQTGYTQKFVKNSKNYQKGKKDGNQRVD